MFRVGVFQNYQYGAKRFAHCIDKYDIPFEIVELPCNPDMDAIPVIRDAKCDSLVLYTPKQIPDEFYRQLADMGIKFVTAEGAGYDHYNIPLMNELGIKGANIPQYSPNAISEHTVLLLLSVLRNYREQLDRIADRNFNITGLLGREIRNLKIGVVGAGRIGFTTIKCLSGFGPKIYAYDIYENDKVKEYAEYVTLNRIFKECDVLIFHTALTKDNYHMVNKESLAMMKDGVVLINTSRGPIFDTDALIEGIESGKIGGLGLDVIEGEGFLGATGTEADEINRKFNKLMKNYNVTFTRHSAFFTDEALRNMGETALDNIYEYIKTGSCKNEVVDK